MCTGRRRRFPLHAQSRAAALVSCRHFISIKLWRPEPLPPTEIFDLSPFPSLPGAHLQAQHMPLPYTQTAHSRVRGTGGREGGREGRGEGREGERGEEGECGRETHTSTPTQRCTCTERSIYQATEFALPPAQTWASFESRQACECSRLLHAAISAKPERSR